MIRNMEVLSHTPASEIKKGPAWLPGVCALCIAALMYSSHLFGNSVPGYICMFVAVGTLMMIALTYASHDVPEKYHVRFAPGMTLQELQTIKEKWHICEHTDGTATLTRKFPEEEEEYV